MTDNRVTVTDDGHESVTCHRGDGWGIARLVESGVEVLVLSTETNPVVLHRSRKLKLEDSAVGGRVQIGPNGDGGYQLSVLLEVVLPGVEAENARELADAAHQVCPYSNATRGNIDVTITISED